MGHYYNPPPPHIGAAQPLEKRKLTPSSGPLPQSPFRGSRVGTETLVSWAAAVATVTIVLPHLLVPQPAAATTPLFKKTNFEIYRAWDAAAPAPITAKNLNPPISGPTPQNPPFAGTRVPTSILVGWLPAPLTPIVAGNLDPPISAAVAAFPFTGSVISAATFAWYAPPALISLRSLNPSASGPAPQNPPIVGTHVPVEIQVGWIPTPPIPIVAVNLKPPIGIVAPSNPPFIGTYVPIAVRVARIPPPPLPIVAINLDPPINGPVISNPPFAGTKVPTEVLASWLPPAPYPIVAVNGLPQSAPAPFFPYIGSVVPVPVQAAWLPPAPRPITGPLFTIGAPVASNPPFTGARTPLEVLIGLIPPPPASQRSGNIPASLFPIGPVTVSFAITEIPDVVSVTVTFTPPPTKTNPIPPSRDDYGWFARRPPLPGHRGLVKRRGFK